MKKPFLITGATGILGSWIVAESLRRGHQPIVLLRGPAEVASERLHKALAVPQVDPAAVQVILGDARQPLLGIDPKQWEDLRTRIGGFIHCAASTSFSKKKDELVWDTNVGGVERLINMLDGTGIPLYHTSTSYVSGTGAPIALESDLKSEETCRNMYETSKRAAEILVNEAHRAGRIQASIFRPAIIIGATANGRIGEFLNFYQLFRLIDLVRQGMFPDVQRLRILVHPKATLNLVPVDWVAQALWQIIETEGPTGHTYHLTNPDPFLVTDLTKWTRSILGERAAEIIFCDTIEGEMGEREKRMNELAQSFRDYVSIPEPHFDRGNTDRALNGQTPFPPVDGALFTKLMDFAIAINWESPLAHR